MSSKGNRIRDIYNFDSQGFQKIKNSQEYDQNNKPSSQSFQGIHLDISQLRKSETNLNYQTKQAVWQIVALSLILFTFSVIAIYSVVALQELSKSVQNQQIQIQEIQSNIAYLNQKNDQFLKGERDYQQQILSLTEKVTKTTTEIDHIQKEFIKLQSFQEQLIKTTTIVDQITKELDENLKNKDEIKTITQQAATQIEILQKDVVKIQGQVLTDQQTQIEQNQNIGLIKNDILAIKNVIEQVKDLPSQVSFLQLDSSKLQSEMTQFQSQGLSVKIDEIKFTLNNVLTQQQNLQQTIYSLPNNSSTSSNINSEISSIKESIADLQTSINVGGIINTIQSYGPFVSDGWIQYIYLNSYSITYYQTTKECSITTTGKAVITLIATGLGICNSCFAQMTFIKNRILHLQNNGYNNHLNGSQFIYNEWYPINLTQEFFVEAGTYEFVLGFTLADSQTKYTVEVQSLLFVAKVTYYS